MSFTTVRIALLATLASAAFAAQASSAQALEIHPQNDLFYNYYTGPAAGHLVGHPAQLYISPRPTPAHVGHTYFTYQPLLPHEFLYRPHAKVYTRTASPYGGIPQNRTTVRWW